MSINFHHLARPVLNGANNNSGKTHKHTLNISSVLKHTQLKYAIQKIIIQFLLGLTLVFSEDCVVNLPHFYSVMLVLVVTCTHNYNIFTDSELSVYQYSKLGLINVLIRLLKSMFISLK